MGKLVTIKVDITKKRKKVDEATFEFTPEWYCRDCCETLLRFYTCSTIYQFNMKDKVIYWVFVKQTNTTFDKVIEDEINYAMRKSGIDMTYVIYHINDRELMDESLNIMPTDRIIYSV